MDNKSVKITEAEYMLTIKMNSAQGNNTITKELLQGINNGLSQAEKNKSIRMVILEGSEKSFCKGMDFSEINKILNKEQKLKDWVESYFNLLERFTKTPKVIISKIEAPVHAGGIGIVAASDIVLSKSDVTYTLSEALFGLLPANVMPFLIKRIGIQKAYLMTLTTQPITVQKAYEIGLVDQITDQMEDSIRQYFLRFKRIQGSTIKEIKAYFRKLWGIDEKIKNIAVNELLDLIKNPQIQKNIYDYSQKGIFPWE